MCLTDGPWDIVATFEVLQWDYGFAAMSSGVRVTSEFVVHTLLEITLDPGQPLTDKLKTKTHVRSNFKRVSGKACRATLQVDQFLHESPVLAQPATWDLG